MKATELRIGNLVQCKGWGGPVVVQGTEDGVIIHCTDLNNWPIPYKDVSPIPLTEEWLKKFGFGKSSHSVKTMKEKAIYFKDIPGFTEVIFSVGYNGLIWTEVYGQKMFIGFVHQLQNYWLILSDKELTIQE